MRSMAIQEKQAEIDEQHQEQMRLKSALYSALPHTIADRVVKGETVNDQFEHAAVMFVDVVGFTETAASIPANYVVNLLDTLFSKCDDICGEFGLTKIKTIGDSYLAVAFPLPDESEGSLAKRSARAAQKILEELHNFNLSVHVDGDGFEWRENVDSVQVRIGLHSGPLVAGILGSVRLQYDVWGDTVNLAARMESRSEPGKIQTTEEFAIAITDNAQPMLDEEGGVCLKNSEFELHLRGTIDVKGRGEVKTWWLSTQS